jgi:hypothetical protein
MANELAAGPNTVQVNYTGPNLPVRVIEKFDHVRIPIPVGEATTFDLTAHFSGTVTKIVSTTTIPHTSSGKTITITPETAVGNQSVVVRGFNSGGQAVASVTIFLQTVAAAPLTGAATSWPQVLEVGLHMHCIDSHVYFTGGVWPFTFEKVSGPDWVNVELNGICWGRADEAHGATDLVVRCTDRNGATATRTVVVLTTLAEFDRTTNVTNLATGGDSVWQAIIDHYAAQGGVGTSIGNGGATQVSAAAKVIQLSAGTYTWFFTTDPTTQYGRFNHGEQPLIVRGAGDTTVINGQVFPKGAANILFENLKINSAPDGNGIRTLNSPRHIWFRDILIEGSSFVVDPESSPEDAWQTEDLFAYTHLGALVMDLEARQITFQDMRFDKASWCMQARGREFGIHSITTSNVGVDMLQIGFRGGICSDLDLRDNQGNYKDSQHRDGLQVQFSSGEPRPQRMAIVNSLISSDGNAPMQGLFTDGSVGNEIDIPSMLNSDMLVRDVAVVSSAGVQEFGIDRWANFRADRMIVLAHPKWPTLGTFYIQGASSGTLRDSIIGRRLDAASPSPVGHNHMTVLDNTVLINAGPTTITDIFPAWTSAGTSGGRAEDLARLVMDSDWKAANPGIGPQWVRDLT